MSNPLSLNQYTYVENAPLNNVDPTGYWCISADGKWSHPGSCSSSSGKISPDVNHNGDAIKSNGKSIGKYKFDYGDGVHEDNSWTGMAFDVVVTGGVGLGKSLVKAVSKGVASLFAKSAGSLVIEEGGRFTASEISAAKYMQQQGNNVILRNPVGTRAGGGTSDLLVNGVNYDVYTPTTSNVSRIISAMASKNSQTTGIVLDLSKTSVTAEQLGNALARVRGSISAGGKIPNISDIVILPK
ncbi:hypothetical protein D3C87_1015560 [compost metagenome]